MLKIHIIRRHCVPLPVVSAIRRLCTEGQASSSSRLPYSNSSPAFLGSPGAIQRQKGNDWVQNAAKKSHVGLCQCRYFSEDRSAKTWTQGASQEHDAKDKGNERKVDDHDEEDAKSDDDGSDYEDDDSEEGITLTDEEIQHLSKGDPEIIKKIKYIQLEHAVMKQEGKQVPSKITLRNWEDLLLLDSRSKRLKYHSYLFKIEMSKLSRVKKKLEKQEKRMEEFAANPMPSREEDIYGMYYNLSRNTLFLRLYDTKVNKVYNGNVCSAMLHHPPLIFDCSYDEYMTPREAKNCAKQMEYVIAENRRHKEPYNIYLCNAKKDSKMMNYLHRMVPILYDDSFAVNIHEESFTELFPKNRLVYLTPHTRDDLEEYNEDDIYIIGSIVDRSDSKPYSLAKAKKLDITMKRLPLDKYLMWGLGGKSLTLNQMVRIMLDVRYSRGDWKEALRHVPMRKLNREFHPYPDQIDEGKQGQCERRPSEPWMSQRREKRSVVLEDYELLNRQKGFRRSAMYTPPSKPIERERVRAPKMRSLLSDVE